VQEERDQPQQCDDVFFWQTHSVDEHRDKKHGERYQFAGKRYLVFGTLPPSLFEQREFSCQIIVQQDFEILGIFERPQICVLINRSM
jgi:hypothetical protein